MIREALYKNRFLWILLLYGLIVIASTTDYNSAHVDEAHNILMGQKVIDGQPCYPCKQYPGSVMIEPVLAALGDHYWGLRGARAAGIFFGLGLTAVVYWITRTLFEGKYGLISAMLFLFSGTSLYLSKLATFDIVSAFFLGLALLLLLLGEKKRPAARKGLLLLAAAFALFLSAITKYVVAVFIPPLVLFVFLRNRPVVPVLFFFLLPLAVFFSLYGYFALYPAREILAETLTTVYGDSQVPFRTLSDWIFRWMAMPCLLSVFGMFHEEKGKVASVLLVLSTPILLLHLFTGVEQSANRDVIFSHIFLAPAAAIGVDHLGNIFSLRSLNLWVKPFFVTMILIVLWVFGFQELRWLEKQYPDMSPVIMFFKKNGYDGMTVSIDSNYGVAAYEYSLGAYYPRARFLSVAEMDGTDDLGRPTHENVNFIVLDGYYGKKDLRDRGLYYLRSNYFLMENFRIPVSWGTADIKIFGRRNV